MSAKTSRAHACNSLLCARIHVLGTGCGNSVILLQMRISFEIVWQHFVVVVVILLLWRPREQHSSSSVLCFVQICVVIVAEISLFRLLRDCTFLVRAQGINKQMGKIHSHAFWVESGFKGEIYVLYRSCFCINTCASCTQFWASPAWARNSGMRGIKILHAE